MTLFTLGNSSDAFLLFRVEEAIQRSGAVLQIVHGIPPLHAMILLATTAKLRLKCPLKNAEHLIRVEKQ